MSGKRFIVLTLIVTLLVSLLYVRSRFWVVEMSYQISQKNNQKLALEQERRVLGLELATLRNPKRVEHLALKKLNLKRPRDLQSVIFVRGERHEVP